MNNILHTLRTKLTHEAATWFPLFAVVSIVLLLLITRHTTIGFLQIYSIDEYVFHGSVRHMYESLLGGNFSGLFGYGFYQYGFIYFFLNLLAATPGIALHQTWLAILGPRIITALFAIGSLGVIYHFARLYTDKKIALLFTAFFVTLPAFWFNASWFHPDFVMTFFLLGFVYFLARDKWQYQRNFFFGIVSYGLAIAFKYQAITFAPLLIGYIFYDTVRHTTSTGLIQKIRLLMLSVMSIAGIFIVANPFIIHPMGWQAFSTSFVQNMLSNATNHGSSAVVTIADKISLAISTYYLNIIFFFIFNLAALWLTLLFFKHKEKNIFVLIAINYLVNLTYLFFFVHKAWQTYYLPVIFTGLLICVYYLQLMAPARAARYLGIALSIQLLCFGSSYYPLLSVGRDSTSPDYITYTTDAQRAMDTFVVQALQPLVTPTSVILLSAYTPLSYESLGLPYEQVKVIFGALTLDSFDLATYIRGQRNYWGTLKTDEELSASFKPVDFIVLRKDVPYIATERIAGARDTTAYTTGRTIVDGLYDNTYDYALLTENDYVVIFTRTTK